MSATTYRKRIGQYALTACAVGAMAMSTPSQASTPFAGVDSSNSSTGEAYGIETVEFSNAQISGNRIRGIAGGSSGLTIGIRNFPNGRVTIRDNEVTGSAIFPSTAVTCVYPMGRAKNNVLSGFSTGIAGCSDDGNVIAP